MARRTIARDGPDPIDVHVGSHVRLRRTLLGMNQTQLGEALRLSFQQVHNFERGFNHISASRLYQLSQILDVPLSFFFEGLEEGAPTWSPDDVMVKTETLKFVSAYYRIRNPAARKRLREMTQAMAGLARG